MSAEAPVQISYGDWNLPYRELKDLFSTEEAARRDAAGEEYWVLFGDPRAPSKVLQVEVRRVDLYVVWLDDKLRPTTTSLFVPEDKTPGREREGRLFLEQVHFKMYDDSIPKGYDDLVGGGGVYFNHDGSAFHVQNVGDGREEARTQMSAEEAERFLWEPHPVFGDWESITRFER